MAVKSSIHIKPCNISSSEAHNLRTPEYMRNIGESKIYLIPELVANNEHWINPRICNYDLQTHYDNIKQMVKAKTGRAMQEKERERKTKSGKIIKVAGCSPIREGVLLIKSERQHKEHQIDLAEQELKQVKSEIRTDKLKSVATDAATALASGVSSLFGSGKMKSLKRKNEDLRDEIAIRDETIEQLQSNIKQMQVEHQKQMQEVKKSYEEENRKQSDYINKILYYFPYVEKLMPMIKYLSEKMGFTDDLIRKLCTFKDVSVTGKLYSSEHNQSFSANGAICSLKQDREGHFDLNIDGVSRHSWFRRKKDEFMEALGLPTSRRVQNRGLKL